MALSLKLIEHAVALAQTGNFARAAERLGIAQPTLTRNIAALEAELVVRLFDRGRKGAVPTTFGRTVVERGAMLRRDAQALQAELHALSGLESGLLEIAAGPYAAEDLVAPAVARLVRESCGLRVRVTVVPPDHIGAELLSGRHELGVGSLDSLAPHDELQVSPLSEQRLYLACRAGHPLANKRPTQPQVLRYPLVTVVMHGPHAQTFPAGMVAAAIDLPRGGVTPAIEVTSLDMAKQIARHSDALFPGSAPMLADELGAGRLVKIDYDSPQLRAQPALLQRRHRSLSPAAQRFVQLLREVESELVDAEAAAHAPARPRAG